MPSVDEAVLFLQSYAQAHPGCTKGEIVRAARAALHLEDDRKTYFCADFAIKFCQVQGNAFVGTVVALKKIQRYDRRPFLVCVVRPSGIQLLIANATFINKVSHTSQKLSAARVTGSINGSNILGEYGGLPNEPGNFARLFEIHSRISWEDNLERLAASTGAIIARGKRFVPSPGQIRRILLAPQLAASLSLDPRYAAAEQELAKLVQQRASEILSIAGGESSKSRGDRIEALITGAKPKNQLGDIHKRLPGGPDLEIDVKSKVLSLESSPKAYNIDKFLRTLSRGDTAFSFLVVGIDLEKQEVACRLVSALDANILGMTTQEARWSGRNSRGGTQLVGDLGEVLKPGFSELIDVGLACARLRELIAIGEGAISV